MMPFRGGQEHFHSDFGQATRNRCPCILVRGLEIVIRHVHLRAEVTRWVFGRDLMVNGSCANRCGLSPILSINGL